MKISGDARVNDYLCRWATGVLPLLEWMHLSCPDIVCHSADVNTTPLELETCWDMQLAWL